MIHFPGWLLGSKSRRRPGRVLRSLSVFATVVGLVVGTAVAFDGAQAATWKAGAAQRAITPDAPLWMAGYAHRDHPAEGTLIELWAKALCLEDPQGQVAVVVTLDLIGIDRELSRTVCERLSQAYPLDRRRIALCASHTHTGPVVSGNLRSMHYEMLTDDQRALVNQYARRLEDSIVAVVGEALAARTPCQLSWGSGTAAFAVNRRNNPESDVPALRAAGQLRGPTDHAVPVLAVKDAQGSLKAVLFGYACHLTVLSSYQWSGDYAGFAQMALERDFPGCVALFWAGCGGDQNPLPRREVALAQQYGHELAGSVKQVLDGPLAPIEGNLVARYAEIDLPFSHLPDAANWSSKHNRRTPMKPRELACSSNSLQLASRSRRPIPIRSVPGRWATRSSGSFWAAKSSSILRCD